MHQSNKVKQQIIVSCPFCYATGRHFFRKIHTYGPDEYESVETRLACSDCFRKFIVTIKPGHPTTILIEGE